MNGHRTFRGYCRSDGTVGAANYWVVIPMVFCENRNVNVLRETMPEQLGFNRRNKYAGFVHLLKESYENGKPAAEIADIDITSFEYNKKSPVFANIDGIAFLTHQGGCGGTRQDANALCGLLAGYITNPNVAGATVLSLGCQNAQVEILLNEIKKRDAGFGKPLYVLDQQQTGIETDLITNAIKQTFYGLAEAGKNIPREASFSKICLGIETDAADTPGNALAACVSDKLIAAGGTVIISHASRLTGAAHALSGRFADEKAAQYFAELIAKYEYLFSLKGIYSQKQKDGSAKEKYTAAYLAAIGNAAISGVLDYPEKAVKQGLNLLFTSDDSAEAVTALAGSGATVILSANDNVIENPVAPVIKITDYLGRHAAVEAAAERIMDVIGDLAGLDPAGADAEMRNGFIPWKRGISL